MKSQQFALRVILTLSVMASSTHCCVQAGVHAGQAAFMAFEHESPGRQLLQNNNSAIGAETASGPEMAGSDGAATSRSPPPPPPVTAAAPPASVSIAPRNITVVTTPKELQDATLPPITAQDIEIREHLDLTQLTAAGNPAIMGAETEQNRKNFALLYSYPPIRTIRGNCQKPNATDTLGLSAEEASEMVPLKPFQCVLLVSETFLMVNSGQIWLDNVYLKLKRSAVRPSFAFITAGALDGEASWPNVKSSDIYVTDVTFHAEHRGSTKGLITDTADVSIYVDNCIFTDWSGDRSPFTIKFQGLANIRNSVFRNMDLVVEIADVSYDGIVRFQNVSFANVSLEHGAIVSTTSNDYQLATGSYLTYYAEDDQNYDVEVAVVPPVQRGMFGEEFRISEAIMSDCIYVLALTGTVYPGCPASSLGRRKLVQSRGQSGGGVPFNSPVVSSNMTADAPDPGGGSPGAEFPADYIGGAPFAGDYNAVPGDYAYLGDYAALNDPNYRLETRLLEPNDPWFVGTQAVLPNRPARPANWPPFVYDAGPPTNRTSIADSVEEVPPEVAALIVGPLQIPSASNDTAEVVPDGDSDDGLSTAAIAVITLVVLLALALCGFLLWFCVVRRTRRQTSDSDSDKRGMMAGGANDTCAGAGLEDTTALHAKTMHIAPSVTQTSALAALLSDDSSFVDDGNSTYTPSGMLHAQSSMPSAHTGKLGASSVMPPVGGGSGFSRFKDASLLREGSLQRDGSVPTSALNPQYEYELPRSLALVAPEREAPSGELLKPSLFDRDAGGYRPRRPDPPGVVAAAASAAAARRAQRAATVGDTPSDPYAPPAPPSPEQPLISLDTTWTPSAAMESDASTPDRSGHGSLVPAGSIAHGAGSNTAPIPGQQRAPSLQARSGGVTGSTIVRSPYGDTEASRRTQVYVPLTQSTVGANTLDGTINATINGTIDNTIDEDEEHDGSTAVGIVGRGGGAQEIGRPDAAAGADVLARPGTYTTLAPSADVGMSTTDVSLTDKGIRAVLKQLDVFTKKDLFLGRFEMLGRHQRRRGGQAVVQFARGSRDRCDYAVKFFLDPDAFFVEAALYAACFPAVRESLSPEVATRAADMVVTTAVGGSAAVPMSAAAARFLPQVEAVCDGVGGDLLDPSGRQLPPCIVMEKGESLQEWSNRAEPDLFTALAVLSNISMRLADMHDAGYVHRDLKPANVMWLPRENRWTVIDFGCVAGIGEVAPLSFTLAYAPPEVVKAFHDDQRMIESTTALDAWSLGVMAFELLTGSPAFNLLTDGRCRVIAQLRGDLPLPWEGELSSEMQRKLGAFKGPVLQLLQRNPERRVSMRRFHVACTKLFASRTTVEA